MDGEKVECLVHLLIHQTAEMSQFWDWYSQRNKQVILFKAEREGIADHNHGSWRVVY